MSELTVTFAFEIGDIVYSETSLEDWRNKLSYPKSMIINERVAKQCCGGVQLFYYVSNFGSVVECPEAALVLAADVREELRAARKETWGAALKKEVSDDTPTLP